MVPFKLQEIAKPARQSQRAGHHSVAALPGRVELPLSAELALNTTLISEGIYFCNQLGRNVIADEMRERSVSLSTSS